MGQPKAGCFITIILNHTTFYSWSEQFPSNVEVECCHGSSALVTEVVVAFLPCTPCTLLDSGAKSRSDMLL